MAKKKGLGASFRQQVEKVPVVQQKAPRTISTNVSTNTSTNTSNRGGGLGASFKTATQKAEEDRSARMRQGISSVVRASFKRQMSQPTTVQKSALKPLATNALAPVKNASTGFKMNVRRNLAPMKEIANYTRNQQYKYAPTPSMDVLPAEQRKTRINVDYGNKLRAGMPSTNTALMSWRSDPTQREREYRDKYGYTQKVKEVLDRRLNENMLEAYYSPTTGEIRESKNGRAFSAGHTDAWARENVEDTIRRQYGIEPDEETLAKIEAQRGTVNYGAGTMLGQGEQYLLTRGLLGTAGLVGKSADAISDANRVVRVLENRGVKTGTAKAITSFMQEMGIDQAASVPLNLVDAMKADGGANVIKRFGINQGLDVLFSGLFEIPSLRRNINFLNGNELNEAANAMQEGTEKISTKIGAKRHLDTAVNETGDVARREAEQISMFNDNGEIAVGRMPEQPRVEQPVVETQRVEVPQEPVKNQAAAGYANREGDELRRAYEQGRRDAERASAPAKELNTSPTVAETPRTKGKDEALNSLTDEELDRLVREQDKEIYNKMSTDELQAELRRLGKNPTVTKDAEGAAEMGIKEAMEPDEIADRVDVINEILAERGVKGTTNKGASPQPKSKVEEPKAEPKPKAEEPKTAEKSEEPKAETASKEEVFVSEEQVDKVFNDAIRKRSYRFETLRAYPRSGDMRIIIGDRAYDERGFRRLIREDLERTKAQVNEAINARAAKVGKQKASIEEPKAEPKAEPSSTWDEIENEIDNIPTKEPANKLKTTTGASKTPNGVERLDSETQEAIEKSKRMTQKEKEASKEAGDYPGGMPKEMEGQPLNKGFDSITRKDADTSDAAVLDIMESVTMGGEGRKVSRGVKEMQEEAAARWENDTATSLKKITVATEGLKDGTIPKGYDTFQEYFADVKEGIKYYQKLQKEAGEGTDAYWKAVENEADIARGAAKVTSNMGAGFRQYQEILGASPKARVVIVQKEIKKIEKQFEKLLKGKEIKPLSPEVTKMLEEAQTPVQQAEALEQASIEIWSQIPASLKEKADQWRMTSMLLNPKTHIRNIFGNFLFRPAILIKDAFSTPGEKALIKAGKIDPEDATKAFVSRLNAKDRTYRDAAKKVWNEYQTIIRRSGGKYFDTVDSKGFLTSRPFEVGRFTAGKEDPNAVQRALDFLAKKNGDALEAEDAYFMRGKFVDSYAKILKARKLDPAKMTEEQLQSAIDDAAQEALRSTYRDASGLANAINKARNYKPDASAGKKLVGWAVDATLPFVKTPVNILRRAKDYSPIGFIEGAANLTKALSKGDSKAAVEALDRVASGLTGGGICALGLFLGQMGLLDSKLEDGSEGFYKQDLGYQNYSLKLGGDDGVSISLSWAAPLSIPLFTGVEYAKMRENGLSPKDWVKFVDVAGRIFDPTMEMSVMQGPMALLEAISDGENGGDKILKGGLSVGLNYVGQYYPTISGQVARTVDPVRRNTSSTAESPTGRALEKWKNKQIAKTPFLSQTLEPYVNVWGEEQKTTDNVLLRAAYEFGSPAYVNKIKADEVDKEIIRLNKAAASDDDKIIPSKYFSNAISFDGGKVSLDAKDLTMYNKIKGKASKEAIRKLIKTDEYKNANNDGKRELINNVMKNASTEAKQKTLISKGKDEWKVYTEGFTGGWEEQADAAKDAGIKAEQYYKYKTDKSVDLDENGGKSQYEVYTYLEGTDLTKSQKSALWNAYNKGWKNNPYAGGNIPEAPDPDEVKAKAAKKEAETLSKAKSRTEGSIAAKAFESSVMKRAAETASLLEESKGSKKSRGGKRGRSGRRSSGGSSSVKPRAKTESEKRFAALQKMQAPKTGKGIEALSKNAKGLTKAQKKALIKLMQKKLDV